MNQPNPPHLPPQAILMGMVQEYAQSKALHVAAELGIADAVGTGEKDADTIAREVGSHPEATYRLMRALATRGLWEETSPRTFKLTAVGGLLRRDAPEGLRDYVLYGAADDYVRIWNQLRDAIKTGEPIFEKVMGTTPWEQLAKNKEFAGTFSRAMTALSAAATGALLGAYDFAGIGSLLDIGGGYGLTLTEVLRAHPSMRGAVLELASVAPGARSLVAERALGDRCQVIEGSFFESVPSGYDAYFMKSVLHDFDDDKARTILKNVRKAIGAGGRVLVADFVIPPGNAPHPGKWMDLHMLVMLGGRERTEKEFAALFESAGFALHRVVPTRGPIALVEGRPV